MILANSRGNTMEIKIGLLHPGRAFREHIVHKPALLRTMKVLLYRLGLNVHRAISPSIAKSLRSRVMTI